MKPLHIGKKTQECKLSITESADDYIRKMAAELHCTYADVARDFLYLGMTGKLFSEHEANDRRSAMQREGQALSQNSARTGTVSDEPIRTNPN